MRIEVLTVPDCPNGPLALERVREALEVVAEGDIVVVLTRPIQDAEEAAESGLRGSPTILIDGVDPFAEPEEPTSLACRLYREDGAVAGAPSTARLVEALAARLGHHRGRRLPEPGISYAGAADADADADADAGAGAGAPPDDRHPPEASPIGVAVRA